jgi:hypothetical protein
VQEFAYDDKLHSTWTFPFRREIRYEGGYVNAGYCIVSNRTNMELCWLPEHREPSDSDGMDVHGDRLAIGSWRGTLTLLDTSRLQSFGNELA